MIPHGGSANVPRKGDGERGERRQMRAERPYTQAGSAQISF